MSETFLRWFRKGIAASLDGAPLDPPQGARAKLGVNVEISATGHSNQIAVAKVELLGPADVSGIDSRQVIRCFPVAGTIDFEPGYFAHVEFRRPDLPWMFSPVPANTAADTVPNGWNYAPSRKQHTVTPWLCLAVIPRRDGVTIERASPTARLKISNDAGAELPLLEEVHAWAHVQVSGALDFAPATIADKQPQRMLSRLISARKLEPRTRYYACVLPVFKSGVQSGLGQEVSVTKPDDLAWTGTEAQIELPVYFHWEFQTADSGDFESLVRRLEPREEIPGAGTRPLDITDPGFGLNARAATQIQLGGALRVAEPATSPIDATFAADVVPIINATDAVAPPIYGRWLAASNRVNTPANVDGWVDELNLDPRYRVAAGLGTQIVQDRQEDLMAAIWSQYGEIVRANQLLRQAQLAVAVSERLIARHFDALSTLELLAVVGPAIGRIRAGGQLSMRGLVRQSCLPVFALSGAFRKIFRSRGPIGRRFARLARGPMPDVPTLDVPVLSTRSVLERLAQGDLKLPAAGLPAGAIRTPFDATPNRQRPPGGGSSPNVPAEIVTMLRALESRIPTAACTPLDEPAVGKALRAALTPDVAIVARVAAQLTLPPGITLSPRLDPIMVAPEIPTPMMGPLIDKGQDWLLPGLEALPRNSVALVEPDKAFIESYMVGLNHEMSRELLWRGFPTDQRGTVFARFWDRRGSVSNNTTPVPEKDIGPIHLWGKQAKLGDNLQGASGDFLVLLIRGDLLQRYPGATIYLQRARWQRNAIGFIPWKNGLATREPVPLADAAAWESDTRFPLFSGKLGDDITFLGFPRSREEVRGDSRERVYCWNPGNAGWFVVFQEQPTEPRFGLDAEAAATPSSWNDLGWPSMTKTTGGYLKIAESSTTQRFSELAFTPKWDGRSDSLAAILLQRRFRMFIHASDLVVGS